MTQAERRHDRLAVRLSLIISRLVAGETLSVRKLAAEFGVSVRTLRRDFRERLMYPLLNRLADMGQTFARWMQLFPNIARVRRENLHAAHRIIDPTARGYLSID